MKPSQTISNPTLPEDTKADLPELQLKPRLAAQTENLVVAQEKLSPRQQVLQKNKLILVGAVFGRLTITEIYYSEKRKKRTKRTKCSCSCGNSADVAFHNLISGDTTSCGCYRRETASAAIFKHGQRQKGTITKVYRAWCSMRRRCYAKGRKDFHNYGGRGITVCPQWKDFSVFLADMGQPPSPTHSLDRIDNERAYSPTNCRWATPLEQISNRRVSVLATFNGVTKTLGTWSRHLGFVLYRLNNAFYSHQKRHPEVTPLDILKKFATPEQLEQAAAIK